MATKNLIQLLASGLRDLGGAPLAGGKVYHYETGTTTLKALYTDGNAGTAAAQPIILDSRGCAQVYGTGLYDFVVQDSTGASVETITGLNAGDAPGSLTAAAILTLLKTVDGATSGLDADLLDGEHKSAFQLASGYTAADVLAKLLTVDGIGSGLDADKLDGVEGAGYATAAQGALADTALQESDAAKILTALKTVDGIGSGLDADLLDGKHGSEYAIASHEHLFADLADFAVATPVAGQILQFNGTKWANAVLSAGGIVAIQYTDGDGDHTIGGTVTYPCFCLDFYVYRWSLFQIILYQFDAGGEEVLKKYLQDNHIQDHGVWGGDATHIKLYFNV